MESSDLSRPTFHIVTFLNEQEIIAEDMETEVAARIRFTSAIDLCKSRDDEHRYRVELRSGSGMLDVQEQRQR